MNVFSPKNVISLTQHFHSSAMMGENKHYVYFIHIFEQITIRDTQDGNSSVLVLE